MILQAVDFLQILAEIIGAILNVLKPVVSPIGAWMISWIEVIIKILPKNDLTLYIILFVIILVTGAVCNAIWPGDKPPRFFEKKYKLIELEREPESNNFKIQFKKKPFNEFKEPEQELKSSEEYEEF